MLKTMILSSFIAVGTMVADSYGDEWNEAEINSFRLTNEKLMQFEATTMQCANAPCTATIYYVVENNPQNWPSHSTSELKQFQAMILTAMSTSQKVKVNFSWSGYLVPGNTSGGYFLNWLELKK